MSVQEWFNLLDSYNSEPFLLDREQPLAPERIIFEDDDEEGGHDA